MRIISHEGEVLLVEMGGGDEFLVINRVHPNLDEFAEITRTSRNGDHLVFNKTVYLVINKFFPKRQTIESVYFARAVEPGKKPHLRMVTVDLWAKEALRYHEKEMITVPPRLNWVILYSNEIAIANFNDCGQYGWITTQHEINALIKGLPSLVDSNCNKKMWIVHFEDKKITFHWDKQPEMGPNVNDIAEIEYDSASLRCRTITYLKTEKKTSFAMYSIEPPRYIHLRDRFTISMLPPKN